MDIQVGDILRMKKEHPCGSKEMLVLRIGADFKLKCTGCGREFMTPRSKCEKKIKSVIRNACLLCTSPSPRDMRRSRMPSSA